MTAWASCSGLDSAPVRCFASRPRVGVGQLGAQLAPAGPPALVQILGADSILLGPPRVERRDLGGLRGVEPALAERALDLRPAAREVAQNVVGKALQLGGPAAHRLEGEAEFTRQLRAQLGLVEVATGLRLPVEVGAVQGRVAPVGALGEVGHQDVGVELGIAGARGAVGKGRGDHPAGVGDLGAAGAAAHESRLALDVVEGGSDGALVAFAHDAAGSRIAQGPEQRDRLRRREGVVEAGDAAAAAKGDERLTVGGMLGSEDSAQLRRLDLPREAELLAARAHPAPRRLALAGVVVLDPGGDRVEIVGLLAMAELAQREHIWAVVSAAVLGQPHLQVQVCERGRR